MPTGKKPLKKNGALYEPFKPFRTGYLPVSDLHKIYFEESGNPKGKPALLIHGGPGFGSNPTTRRFFNPQKYRLILFDQRGSGKSKPHASLIENTTQHLVADIEALRTFLGIDRWLVFGGSWGSTLGLAYAEKFPRRVSELVLRGIFLLRRSEIDWFYQDPLGAGSLFPDHWEQYVAPIPKAERTNMVKAYYKRLTSSNKQTALRAARAWSVWEAATSYLRPNRHFISDVKDENLAMAVARIECHYFINNAFFECDGQLLRDIKKIRHIPGIIVQGRYDVVCPMRSAWDLHRAWPESDLRIIEDAGHAALEDGTARELVRATDAFAGR